MHLLVFHPSCCQINGQITCNFYLKSILRGGETYIFIWGYGGDLKFAFILGCYIFHTIYIFNTFISWYYDNCHYKKNKKIDSKSNYWNKTFSREHQIQEVWIRLVLILYFILLFYFIMALPFSCQSKYPLKQYMF